MRTETEHRRLTSLGAVAIALSIVTDVCAVQYTGLFEAHWSVTTHPNAYPSSAHFSTPIGTSHKNGISFWTSGAIASAGIEGVAETGSTVIFAEELSNAIAANNAFQIFRGSTFDSPGSQQLEFEVTTEFFQVSLVSMIAPSPDWFVGVSGLDLRDGDQWKEEVIVELYPWDAGTENGNSFSLSNPATSPQEPIRRLDQDESSLFFEAAPLGTLRLELLPLCDFTRDGVCDLRDLDVSDGMYSVGDLLEGVDVIFGVNSKYDMTGDGRIDSQDLNRWLAVAAEENGFSEPYLKGDTNLNDHVGFGDFTTLADNFGTGRDWKQGNYRGSGVTSFPDFLLLAENFGKQIARSSPVRNVPEPHQLLPLVWTLACFVLLRRNRKASELVLARTNQRR